MLRAYDRHFRARPTIPVGAAVELRASSEPLVLATSRGRFGVMRVADAGIAVFLPTGAPVDPRTGSNWEGEGVVPELTTATDAESLAVAHLSRRRGTV